MALEILTVPASSAPVERIFSKAGRILSQSRIRFSSPLLEKLLIISLNNWLSLNPWIKNDNNNNNNKLNENNEKNNNENNDNNENNKNYKNNENNEISKII